MSVPPSRPYIDGLLEDLQDPEEAAAYLNAAIEDGDQEVFLLALRDVIQARGMSKVARETRLNRESLYKMLSAAGNPQLASLNALLRSVGLRIAVEVERLGSYEPASMTAALAEPQPDYHELDPAVSNPQ